MNDRYRIANEFTDGFIAGLRPSHCDPAKSSHWLAGYDAGYAVKKEKNARMNDYLVSIGQEPMGVVKVCGTGESQTLSGVLTVIQALSESNASRSDRPSKVCLLSLIHSISGELSTAPNPEDIGELANVLCSLLYYAVRRKGWSEGELVQAMLGKLSGGDKLAKDSSRC